MKKILLIADSSALPGHLNKYEDTWLYKLKNEYPNYDFISFFKRSLTTDVLSTLGGGETGVDKWPKGADCLEAYMPDTIIIQLGFADCAPRLLFDLERKILKYLPQLIVKIYINLIKKLRNRNTKNTIVNIVKFEKNIKDYVERCIKSSVNQLIFINIQMPSQKTVDKNPDIIENVKKYNEIINKHCKLNTFIQSIEPLNSNRYSFEIFEDGHHPNIIGHNMIIKELVPLLK